MCEQGRLLDAMAAAVGQYASVTCSRRLNVPNIGLTISLITLMACSTGVKPAPDPKVVAFVERCLGPKPGGVGAEQFVGLSEAKVRKEVEAEGLTLRILGRDGECLAHTLDEQSGRINVLLVAGRVAWARRF